MGMLELLMQGNCIGNGDGKKADITKGEREVIWDRGTVIYVDFSGVVDDLDDRTAWLRAIAEQRGLGFVGLRAEDVYVAGLAERLGGSKVETSLMEVDLRSRGTLCTAILCPKLTEITLDLPLRASSSSDAPLESLRKLVSSLPAASRPVLFSNILTSLLHIAARCIPNISHLLLGETSTRQAQRIISGTALGRGWSLPLELASDLNLNGIMRLQPMKDLTVKDATYFCWLNRLDSRNYRSWSARGGSTGSRGKGATSLEGLTERKAFPATPKGSELISGLDRFHSWTKCDSSINDIDHHEDRRQVDVHGIDWKSQIMSALSTVSVIKNRGIKLGS